MTPNLQPFSSLWADHWCQCNRLLQKQKQSVAGALPIVSAVRFPTSSLEICIRNILGWLKCVGWLATANAPSKTSLGFRHFSQIFSVRFIINHAQAVNRNPFDHILRQLVERRITCVMVLLSSGHEINISSWPTEICQQNQVSAYATTFSGAPATLLDAPQEVLKPKVTHLFTVNMVT